MRLSKEELLGELELLIYLGKCACGLRIERRREFIDRAEKILGLILNKSFFGSHLVGIADNLDFINSLYESLLDAREYVTNEYILSDYYKDSEAIMSIYENMPDIEGVIIRDFGGIRSRRIKEIMLSSKAIDYIVLASKGFNRYLNVNFCCWRGVIMYKYFSSEINSLFFIIAIEIGANISDMFDNLRRDMEAYRYKNEFKYCFCYIYDKYKVMHGYKEIVRKFKSDYCYYTEVVIIE